VYPRGVLCSGRLESTCRRCFMLDVGCKQLAMTVETGLLSLIFFLKKLSVLGQTYRNVSLHASIRLMQKVIFTLSSFLSSLSLP
jgi:hypothetical protein